MQKRRLIGNLSYTPKYLFMTNPKAKKYLLDEHIALTASQAIVQFRNRITHEYDKIDDVNVWAIIIKHLPVLKQEAQQMLDDVS